MKKEVAIVGAGLCGLAAAHKLVKNPRLKVSIYEDSAAVGGMAGAFNYSGCTFDYGVHFFHMRDQEVKRLIMKQLKGNLFKREFFARLYTKNEYYDYPPKLPPQDLLEKMADNANKTTQDSNEEESFESWARLKMGDEYYRKYYEEYTGKWWGIPPNGLSGELIKAVYSSLLRDDKIIKWYPLNGGIGILAQKLAEGISNQASILTRHRLIDVETRNNRITNLIFETAETRLTTKTDIVISTIPITELGRLLNISSRGLRFRSLIFLFLIVKKTKVLNSDWIHFSPPEIMASRVYEPRRFSISSCPNNVSCLTVEIPCWKGDRVWNMPDESLKNLVLQDLKEVGIISSEELIDYRISKLEFSHPVYHIGYKHSLSDISEEISKYKNLITCGRLGGYQYATMDMAIRAGFDAAKNIQHCYLTNSKSF